MRNSPVKQARDFIHIFLATSTVTSPCSSYGTKSIPRNSQPSTTVLLTESTWHSASVPRSQPRGSEMLLESREAWPFDAIRSLWARRDVCTSSKERAVYLLFQQSASQKRVRSLPRPRSALLAASHVWAFTSRSTRIVVSPHVSMAASNYRLG